MASVFYCTSCVHASYRLRVMIGVEAPSFIYVSMRFERGNAMAEGCEQLAGELKELESLLKHASTEHKRREIIDRIDTVKEEQRKHGCLSEDEASTQSSQ